MGHITHRTLIVEDDRTLARALPLHFRRTWTRCEVRTSGTLEDAKAHIDWQPTLVLLDIDLPDGRGTTFLDPLRALSTPPAVIVMSGETTAQEAFALAMRGVRAFLPKPIAFSSLTETIEHIHAVPVAPAGVARELVGVASIHDVQNSMRRAMLERALFLTGWNRTAAARMLCVTRQAVQQMIRDLEVSPP